MLEFLIVVALMLLGFALLAWLADYVWPYFDRQYDAWLEANLLQRPDREQDQDPS